MTEWLQSSVWYLDNYKLHTQTRHFIYTKHYSQPSQWKWADLCSSTALIVIVSRFSVSEGGERTQLRLRARLGWRTLLIGHSDNLWWLGIHANGTFPGLDHITCAEPGRNSGEDWLGNVGYQTIHQCTAQRYNQHQDQLSDFYYNINKHKHKKQEKKRSSYFH